MSGLNLHAAADWIEGLQEESGALPWTERGIYDPWNHVESAMGLAAAGRLAPARRAFAHLFNTQDDDGGWMGDLGAAAPMDAQNKRLVPDGAPRLKETNFAAWCAVGLWHLYLCSQDRSDLARFGPMTLAACRFALAHQSDHGEIAWRTRQGKETLEDVDALYAANCAIYFALGCALNIAAKLDAGADDLREGRARLYEALTQKPERFDRTWEPKTRYAMDWYYPVLCGVVEGEAAIVHLESRWVEFVAPREGCRCVVEEPWATAAETAELSIACARVGRTRAARGLLSPVAGLQDEDGGVWMGRQFALKIVWPEEKPGWTAAAAILAEEALRPRSPTAQLFGVTPPGAEH